MTYITGTVGSAARSTRKTGHRIGGVFSWGILKVAATDEFIAASNERRRELLAAAGYPNRLTDQLTECGKRENLRVKSLKTRGLRQ